MRLNWDRPGVTLAFWTDDKGVEHAASLRGSYASSVVVAEIIKGYAEDCDPIDVARRTPRPLRVV